MRNDGATLVELTIGILIVAALVAAGLPRLRPLMDRIAADAAAREITTALAVTRHAAIRQGRRARLVMEPDSLRLDVWDGVDWRPSIRWAGPAERGVALRVSNPEVVYGPSGIGWGASNTTVVLTRGLQSATITTSRVGRVKRW